MEQPPPAAPAAAPRVSPAVATYIAFVAVAAAVLVAVTANTFPAGHRIDLLIFLAAGWIAIWGLYAAYDWTVRMGSGPGSDIHLIRFYLPALGLISLLAAWLLVQLPRWLPVVLLVVLIGLGARSYPNLVAGGPGGQGGGPGGSQGVGGPGGTGGSRPGLPGSGGVPGAPPSGVGGPGQRGLGGADGRGEVFAGQAG